MRDKSVLVVDDAKENLDILVQLLSPHYKVKPATSGKVAIKIAEKTHPDLILLDIMMPEMDGYQVLESLKNIKATASIPVVFVSSADQHDER
ncbi:MAG: response regulator, partial [Spirochaetales bacterium]|nr:response regulator [Spirochaetales bacterium]